MDMEEGVIWEGKRRGGREKENKKRKNEKVSTYMNSKQPRSFLLILACLPMSDIV